MKSWLMIGVASAAMLLLLGVPAVQASPASGAASSATVSASPESVVTTARVRVPNVVGFRMDRATRTLRSLGLRVNEECSGLFGCIVKSQWWVCEQSPRAGRYLPKYAVVVTYAERRGQC
jgi:hypothetical protein